MYAAVTNSSRHALPQFSGTFSVLPLSHGEATENINAGDKHRDKSSEAGPSRPDLTCTMPRQQ